MVAKRGGRKPTATRHCSICRRTGHDRRTCSHKVRRNLDAFVGSGGMIHPIRGSTGYDPLKLRSRTEGVPKLDLSRIRLPKLVNGTPKQTEWANDIRPHLIKRDFQHEIDVSLTLASDQGRDPAFRAKHLKRARVTHAFAKKWLQRHNSAVWWIDHRGSGAIESFRSELAPLIRALRSR